MRVTEKEMATQSSILAWRNPWTEKPGRLRSMWSQNKESDTTEQLSFIWELSMIWKDKHSANWWGNLSIHLLNGWRCNRITKMMINDNEDPWLECAGTTAISSTPRRKPTQMLLPNKTVTCQVSRFIQSRDVQDSARGEMRWHLTFCW